MNRPKFCVGEEVSACGITNHEYDTERTEIIKVEYDRHSATWAYKTENMHHLTDCWWHESSLSKLPKSEQKTFSEVIESIVSQKVMHD